jgi:adenosylcobinamide-GDP ribazoletransferase
MARPFVEGALPKQKVVSHLISLVVCVCFGPAGVCLFLLGWVAERLLRAMFRKMFSGITGDLLGTANEVIETLLLITCALSAPLLLCYTDWIWNVL